VSGRTCVMRCGGRRGLLGASSAGAVMCGGLGLVTLQADVCYVESSTPNTSHCQHELPRGSQSISATTQQYNQHHQHHLLHAPTLTTLSVLADTTWLSLSLTTTDSSGAWWPVSVAMAPWAKGFHILTVLSWLPLTTSLYMEDQSTQLTPLLWP
jgi:hypothetical protein